MSLLPALTLAEKKFRLIKFGNRKEIEKRIYAFFDLSFARNFRHFTFPIPPRKGEKTEKKDFNSRRIFAESIDRCQFFPALTLAEKKISA